MPSSGASLEVASADQWPSSFSSTTPPFDTGSVQRAFHGHTATITASHIATKHTNTILLAMSRSPQW